MTAHSPAVLPLALVAGALVLAAAACGGTGSQTPAPSGPTSSGAPAPTPSGGTPTSPTTSASPVAAGVPGCAVGDLRVRYAADVGGGGTGSVTGTLTFTSTATRSCTLRGFPGVSYVQGGDTQVGQAATRTDDAVRTKTLAPGKSVRAALRRTQPDNYGDDCQQVEVDGLKVFPPGSTESVLVALETTGCKSVSAPLLQVGPVR